MRFTQAELQQFRDRTVPDLLPDPLRLLFIGINPGLWSAATGAHFARRGDVRVGAIIVDHDLQEDSAAVAAQTAQTLTDLGLHPVITEKVQVPAGNMGPEMAARTARYGAFERAVQQLGQIPQTVQTQFGVHAGVARQRITATSSFSLVSPSYIERSGITARERR